MSIEPKRLTGPGSTAVSDLFFNTDLDHCVMRNHKGEFDGYDEDKLREEADSFANCIVSLNPGMMFTADELIADLYARI